MVEATKVQRGLLEACAGPLYYEVTGEGQPLLLIHAGVADHRMWEAQLAPFSQHFKVITYDTRGFGQSPVTDKAYSNRQDIYDLFKHLGVEKAPIVGVSRGGQIAVDFALEHPEMVTALIPVNAGLSGFEAPDPEFYEQLFAEEEEAYTRGDFARIVEIEVKIWAVGLTRTEDQVDSDFVKRARELNPNSNPQPGGTGQVIVLDPPAYGRLDEVKVPTLVIVGDKDLPSVFATADAMVEGIKGARKTVIHDTAHLTPMEKPEEFNRTVLEFLDSL